jgi:hypothetical protein
MLATSWFKRADSDPIKLLSFLNVEENEEICEQAMKQLLKEVEVSYLFDNTYNIQCS